MNASRIAALILALAAAAPARAKTDDALSAAYGAARVQAAQARAAQLPLSAAAGAPAARSDGSFVPRECRAESWCLVKATDCFLGRVERPNGLWKGYAQYSVVRRADALCPYGPNGEWERHVFTGPVEPVPFTSADESDEDAAGASALKLCAAYRRDWVSAAPACAAN